MSIELWFALGCAVLAILAVIGIIYGALVAMVQKDVKKLVAYSSVSNMGFVMIGLVCGTEDGYASIQDELDYGIVSVAVPILGPDGEILAAINCSTATTRVSEQDMVDSRLPTLRQAAKQIEQELGRYPVLIHSIRAASS